MRVAIIAEVFLPKIDGVVGRTLNLIRELQAAGDDVLVVCPEAGDTADSPVPLIRVPGFPCPGYPEYIIGVPNDEVVERLRAFRPDVIHVLNPFAFGFRVCDRLQRAGLNVPMLCSFHTLYGEFVRNYRGLSWLSDVLWWLARCYHNTAVANLTVSSVMVSELRERGFERVALWPPAVDTCRFRPQPVCAEMRARLSGGHPEAPLLLTVSRLASEKNIEFLAGVLEDLPEARLAIVGGGPHRGRLEKRFAGLNASFVGYLKGDDLARAYASSDVFVYASETETMGNVILESLAAGLPVVAAAAGGVPSLVRNGTDGILYPPRDREAAVAAVQRLLQDADQRAAMAAAAVNASARCSWSAAVAEVRRQYQLVVREHQTGSDRRTVPRRARWTTAVLVSGFRAGARLRRATPKRRRAPAGVETAATVSPALPSAGTR